MKLHHVQVLLVGIGVGLVLGVILALFVRGNGDALIVIALIALGVMPFSVAVLGVIEGERSSRQRLRELNAKTTAQRYALLWHVSAPASAKGYSRRRRVG